MQSLIDIGLFLICVGVMAVVLDDDWRTYKNLRYTLTRPIVWLLGAIGIMALIFSGSG